jgi:hypothetical protein
MASRKTTSGVRAHRFATRHVDMLTEAGNELRSVPNIARKLNSLSRGISFTWDYEDAVSYDLETRVKVGDLMGEIAVCDMWKRNGRVAYDLDEELAAALYRSKMDKVPGRIFDRLPHINPMVVLPDPWPVKEKRGVTPTSYVRGFFIFGWVGSALCNTNDPQREGLGVLFFYDHVDEETGELVPGGQRDLIPLPTGRDAFTVKEAVTHLLSWHGDPQDGRDRSDAIKTFGPLLQAAFSVITYLCCDNRDVQEPPVNVTGRRKTGKGRKPRDRDPFWVRVGWYVGPALHEARRRANSADRSAISIPSGVEYGPQHRAGHFKTVWFGPGKTNERTQSTTKWVEPYWTKLEELPENVDPPTQVVPVGAQRHDPLRRRHLPK